MPPVNAFRDGHTHAHAHTHTHTHTHTHAQTKAISENQACTSLMAGLKIIVQIVLEPDHEISQYFAAGGCFFKISLNQKLDYSKIIQYVVFPFLFYLYALCSV